ncbi:MAG: hypothetical protein Q9167_006195 [Letrouitia subvulpina]
MAQPFATKTAAEHGTHIFVYNNIRTNQVVYSLTRSLNNHSSIKQLPFLGKKTVPATLRRDLWTPLCFVTFPRPNIGLVAYRRLRELRRLHETSYPLSLITETEDGPRKGQLMSTKKRGKVLMNQKANSVADMAAVLLMQEKGPTEEQLEESKKRYNRITRLKAQGKKRLRRSQPQEVETGGVKGVKIRWANLRDAEFAETWPQEVVHEGLKISGYTAAWPEADPGEGAKEEEVPVELLEGANPKEVGARG